MKTQVAVYLLHTPDDTVPISETMEGIQALYLAGHFKEVRLLPSPPAPLTPTVRPIQLLRLTSRRVSRLRHEKELCAAYCLPVSLLPHSTQS